MTTFEEITYDIQKFKESKLFKLKFNLFLDALSFKHFKSSKQLESELDVTGIQIRTLTKYARDMKYPIISEIKGYKIAYLKNEILPTIGHLKERMISLQYTIKQLEAYYNGNTTNKKLINRKGGYYGS